MNADAPKFTADQVELLTTSVERISRSRTLDQAIEELAQAARRVASTDHCRVSLHGDGEQAESAAPQAERDGEHAEHTAGDCLELPLCSLEGPVIGSLRVTVPAGALTSEARALLSYLARLGAKALDGVRLRLRSTEQDTRLHVALEAASLGTWEHVPSSHKTYWDARSKAMFGFGPDEELTFDDYVAALHPSDMDQVFAGIAKATDPRGPGECSLEYRIRSRDGVERWVEAHGRCAFSEDGVPERINGTLLDITKRKQAEHALLDSSRRKDEFLALLGHELRNPLAPIRTALDLMERRAPDQSVRERAVIERQVRHMIRLVDDLLDLARVARGTIALKRERLDVAIAVARSLEMTSPLFEEHGHHVEVDLSNGLYVEADPDRLAQVVSNVLSNAARYTPKSGHIWVRTRAHDDEVIIEVEDDGIGLAPEELSTIFQPFVQAKRQESSAHGGLGLGLSLVSDLVRLHGGKVEAHSAGVGRGSRFVIRWPRLETSEAVADTMTRRVVQPSCGRVLVVDDNEDASDMLCLLLENRGFEVRTAYDGPAALAVAAEFRPHAAVLDLGLPVMDGCELAVRLREEHGPGLRLIALTGYGQPEDRARTRSAGFEAHMVKPVEADELARTLSTGTESAAQSA